MTDIEELLISAGAALARSIGHLQSCPKRSPAVPCRCICGPQQSKALADWYDLIEQIRGK